MSSAQEYTAQVIPEEIPFSIHEERWETLPENKKVWWIHIQKVILQVPTRIKVVIYYDDITDVLSFHFKTKNKIYENLKKSLDTYGNAHERYCTFDKEHRLVIRL
jgi:hypothetical protein